MYCLRVGPTEWEQYQQLVDLFRFYLELTVKTVIGFWLVTGGILTLVLANSDRSDITWALSIPILMSVGLAAALAFGLPKAIQLERSTRGLAEQLELDQRTHVEILVWTGSGLLFLAIVVALGMMWLWVAVL